MILTHHLAQGTDLAKHGNKRAHDIFVDVETVCNSRHSLRVALCKGSDVLDVNSQVVRHSTER